MSGCRLFLLAQAVSIIVGARGLNADLKLKITESFSGLTLTRVEYYKNGLRRADEPGGGYSILDPAKKQYIRIDPAKREYFTRSSVRLGAATKDTSQTIVVEVESRDTGERRNLFGHQATHILTTERRSTEIAGRPPSDVSEIVTDGWYLDLSSPVPNHSHIGAVAVLVVDSHRGNQTPNVRLTRRGPAIPGLAVWEKNGDELMMVTELSEAPLDQKLFEIPEGYRRVIRPMPGEPLSWSDELLFQWQRLEDWLSSLI